MVDESGTPVAGAQVISRPPRRMQTQIAYRPRPPDPMRPPVTTDAEGRFRYPVPAGQGLVLVASHPRYAGGDSGPLVASGPSEVAITLHPGRVLRGRVVDRDRAPIARATVSDGAPQSAPAHVAETDADGYFELAGIAPGGHQTVVYAEARGARASPVLVMLPDGFAESIELVVDHDRRIAGLVVDASGAPVGDALVHFQHVVPASYQPPPARPIAVLEPMAAGEVRADGNGSFAISGLAAGEVQLLARVPAAASDRAALPLMAGTTVRAGDESVVLTLPSPARIRGRVVTRTGRPATGLEVSLAPFGGPIDVDDADGRFELDQLDPAPGSYQVHIAAAGSAATEVKATVTASKTTDLGVITLEAGHRLRGRVLEATGGGPVASALVSVDGPEGTRIASCRTDELGGFEVDVPDDPVVVHATVAGVGGSRFELVPTARTTVELHLPETGRLEVTVTGAPPTGPVTVAATRTDANDGGFRIVMLDRDGNGPTFHAEVSPGEYVIHASPAVGLAALKNGDIRHDLAVAVAVGQTQRLSMAIAPATEH